MAFVWPLLSSALQFVDPRNIVRALDRFLEHLGRQCAGPRDRRAAVFLRNLQCSQQLALCA